MNAKQIIKLDIIDIFGQKTNWQILICVHVGGLPPSNLHKSYNDFHVMIANEKVFLQLIGIESNG